jgi:hypothetical protein
MSGAGLANRCLKIPEILILVYGFLKKSEAYFLARYCRGYLDFGLDRIWSDIDSFIPLMACLPEDLLDYVPGNIGKYSLLVRDIFPTPRLSST